MAISVKSFIIDLHYVLVLHNYTIIHHNYTKRYSENSFTEFKKVSRKPILQMDRESINVCTVTQKYQLRLHLLKE